MAQYSLDSINQIIRRFSSPRFHCTLKMLTHPVTGQVHPVIGIPGGFGFPLMSKTGTPSGSIRANLCYMRKPGPESAAPENQADWEQLLGRCLRNRREDMLDAIRAIVEGKPPEGSSPISTAELELQTQFADDAKRRWTHLTSDLGPAASERCPLGHFEFDYALIGDFAPPNLPDFLEILRRAVLRHTGWPEFWVPTRSGIMPQPINDGIECWIGRPDEGHRFHDSAHADYWLASPKGRMFLLRGFIEDSLEAWHGRLQPGSAFDLSIPVWRIGECLLHAARLASLIAPDCEIKVSFRARWSGLAGRHLVSVNGSRSISGSYTCHQDEHHVESTVSVNSIPDSLPEIVYPLAASLLERFGFFRLPQNLPAEELAQMRSSQLHSG